MDKLDERSETPETRVLDAYYAVQGICPEHWLLSLAEPVGRTSMKFTREFAAMYRVEENGNGEIGPNGEVIPHAVSLHGYFKDLKYLLENLGR